jgi:hypothetical protein
LRARFLRGLLVTEIVLLVVLFMFGEFVSFFEIPIQINFGVFSYAGIGLEVHHYIAVFTLVSALLAILFSLKMKNNLLSKLSIVGLALLVGAFASGMAFVFLQENKFYSFAMATFFISATIVYLSAIFNVKEEKIQNDAT